MLLLLVLLPATASSATAAVAVGAQFAPLRLVPVGSSSAAPKHATAQSVLSGGGSHGGAWSFVQMQRAALQSHHRYH